MYNQCQPKQNVFHTKDCAATLAPAPAPPAPEPSGFALAVVAQLFKLLNVSKSSTDCVADIGRADVRFRDFAQDVAAKNYSTAVGSLARALSALSSSVSGCGVEDVRAKVDALAASIRWANVSTSGLDHAVAIMVDASDLWDGIASLGAAVRKGDATAVGDAIGARVRFFHKHFGACRRRTPRGPATAGHISYYSPMHLI